MAYSYGKKKASPEKPKISNNPEEQTIFNREYWIEKAKIGYPFDYFFKKKLTRPDVFEFAPTVIRQDHEINLIGIRHGNSFFHVDEELKNDKNFILEYIAACNQYVAYMSFPDHIKKDLDVFQAAFEKSAEAFRHLDVEHKKNREFVLECAKKNGLLLEFLPIMYEKDLEIFQAAITQNYHALKFVDKKTAWKITKNEDIARTIIDTYPEYCDYVSPTLRNKLDFFKPYLMKDFRLVKYGGKNIFNDEEIMKNVLWHSALISKASPRLRSDKEFMNKAIHINPSNILFIDDCLKNKTFYRQAVQINHESYSSMPDEYRRDHGVVAHLLTKPNSFILLPKDLKETFTEQAERLKIDPQEYARTISLEKQFSEELQNQPVTDKKLKI